MKRRSSDPDVLKAFFGSAAFLLALTVLAPLGISHADALRIERLPLSVFQPLALATFFVAGTIAASVRRSGGRITRMIESRERKIVLAISMAAGAIVGWGAGASLSYLTVVGPAALPRVMVVCGYALLLGLAPLWGHEQLVPFAREYKQPTNLKRPHPRKIRLIGLCVMAIAASGLVMWGMGA